MDLDPVLELVEQFGLIGFLAWMLVQERTSTTFWQEQYTRLSERMTDYVLTQKNDQ